MSGEYHDVCQDYHIIPPLLPSYKVSYMLTVVWEAASLPVLTFYCYKQRCSYRDVCSRLSQFSVSPPLVQWYLELYSSPNHLPP